MKVGDKVRYLNTVGGGIINKIGAKGIVYVLEDDGFETPVLAVEVVVVGNTNEYNAKSEIDKDNKPLPKSDVGNSYVFDQTMETPEGEKLNLSLVFVPQNIKQLQTTSMKLYLVNDSNYYISFQLLRGVQSVRLMLADKIEPQTKLFVDDVDKTQVNDFEFLRIQGFAFKNNKAFDHKTAIDVAIRIKPVDFFKLHSFKDNDYFDEKSFVVQILHDDFPQIGLLIDNNKIKEQMYKKNSSSVEKRPVPHRKQEILEIDLHIDHLVDNKRNMSNFDMLNIQMDKFNSVMQQYCGQKGQKIVFIHGKGEGVLRAEIEKHLKKSYKKCSFQDASFSQYGFGATQVTVH